MLKYDYTIRRDEGDEIREYKPNLIPNTLSELVYIQGPNSSGKSTLLNMIALGFFADKLKDDELNSSLREKIQELRNSNHQEITFEIEIQNESIGKTIKTIKNNFKNKDFKVLEVIDGREIPISHTDFIKDYKLIYDLPSDPIRRLPELLKELNNSQRIKEEHIHRLRTKIDSAIKEIKDGYNPEKIYELKKNIKFATEKIDELTKEITSAEKVNKEMKFFHYLRQYSTCSQQIGKITKEINKTSKQTKEQKQKVIQLTKEQLENIKNLKDLINKGTKLYEEITQVLDVVAPKEEMHHLNIWKKIICEDEFNEPQIHDDLKTEVIHFQNCFEKIIKEDKNNVFSERNFLIRFKEFILGFQHVNVSVPGTGKKIDEFIQIIEQEIYNKNEIFKRIDNVDLCLKKLIELRLILENILTYHKSLELVNKEKEETYSVLKDEIESGTIENLKYKLSNRKEDLKLYTKELEKIGIEPTKAENEFEKLATKLEYRTFYTYTEPQIADKIRNLDIEINSKNEAIIKKRREIEIYVEDLKRIENKEPHKYQNYLKKLESIRQVFFTLESKFSNEFEDTLDKMRSNKHIDLTKLSDFQKKYITKVSEFLGAKVRYIRHIDKKYKIAKLDTISNEIITTTGKRILFNHLGTGQGQGAYLEGLINTNDNRKIIALFDEVAMMDSSTLEPIFETLQELYRNKKLLLGIIVQKQDKEVTIKSLIS